MQKTKFIIIYDTYCGWCYGAAPVFDALVNTGANVEVFHRHLFQGQNAPRMKDGKGDYVLNMDAHISSLTGQVFSQNYTNNVVLSQSEVLDSTYSSLAAALVHDQGVKKEFALRRRLEHQRFIQGTSAQDKQAVIDALIAEGVSLELAQQLDSPSNIERAKGYAQKAIDLMAKVGSKGVPTVLKASDDNNENYEKINHSQFYGQAERVASLVTANYRTALTI